MAGPSQQSEGAAIPKNPFLEALGARVKTLRAQRGLTRKSVAIAAQVSERHLANLEYGTGNASVLILLQVAQALDCSIAELVGDMTTASPEWLLLRESLSQCSDADLRKIRLGVGALLGTNALPENAKRNTPRPIALVGLRGAGKSTLGKRLADDLGYRFIELRVVIERMAGCTIAEIHALYGLNAYRRYEMRALTETIALGSESVIATPGGVVADSASFSVLLQGCTTIWLQASPEDHMKRVTAQGDMRPIEASKEAMQDLKGILQSRSALYSKSDLTINTSLQPLEQTFAALRLMVIQHLALTTSTDF